ncbi:hypothetical protein PQX77_012862 [Marasmius sp. AFHP31]|nr:hypothetical protein PQX77_012862 [Marasmius sp. AFHP31]
MTLAGQMGQFMRNTLYNNSGVFYSGIKVGDLDCPARLGEMDTRVSYAASTMHSLSLLALSSKNDTLTDLEAARRTTGSIWSSVSGVLDTQKVADVAERGDAAQPSQRLLRSYHDLAHADGVSDLKAYLCAYLAIQYDALVKQATFGSGALNLYGPGLRPEGRLDPEAQTLAITILMGGVISNDNAVPPNGPGTTDATMPGGGSRGRAPIGAIVGGVVGGVLSLAVVIAGICFYFRRRRQLQSPPTINPYPAKASPMSRPPRISDSPPFRSGRYAKRVPPTNPIAENTGLTPIPPTSGSQASHMMHEPTTAELVTMLNQRLRNERWDANESPPEYHASI